MLDFVLDVYYLFCSLQNQSQAETILQEVTNTIQSYPFDFRGARILNGMEEGTYGWITINYLLERFIKVPILSNMDTNMTDSFHTFNR